MNEAEAMRVLEEGEGEVVACLQAAIAEAKEIREACLEEGIAVVLDRAGACHAGGCGCAPKFDLLVRVEDVARVEELLGRRWQGMLEREGTSLQGEGEEAGKELPCPACGAAGELEAGACRGCGLQLA